MITTKRILAFLFLVITASCIDPYNLNIRNYSPLLVVEGLITNENNSYEIKLCRTTSREDSSPEKITDANVYIIDGDGLKTHLQNSGDGYYLTDGNSFTGVIGKSYTLQILTSGGKEYRSEACTMFPVAGIDSLYYEKGEEISGILGETFTGINILLNTDDATGMNRYFRWSYEEVWKFILPNPQRYIYINDSTFQEVPVVKDVCWRKNYSGEIVTGAIIPGSVNHIIKQQINFIAPVKSDRLTQQYSILVKQYSISEKEYNFWNNLKKVSEAGGDIFNSQPYPVISNIHNVNDATEMVLGYFEVSAVSQKRIFITAHELDPLYLPHYSSDCSELLVSQGNWPGGDYIFVEPVYDDNGKFLGLGFASQVCSLCEYAGFTAKPDFWVDLE
jgi:hypothetical protein